jgi:hypothetical protein
MSSEIKSVQNKLQQEHTYQIPFINTLSPKSRLNKDEQYCMIKKL